MKISVSKHNISLQFKIENKKLTARFVVSDHKGFCCILMIMMMILLQTGRVKLFIFCANVIAIITSNITYSVRKVIIEYTFTEQQT